MNLNQDDLRPWPHNLPQATQAAVLLPATLPVTVRLSDPLAEVQSEVERLKALIRELDDANNAYAKFTRDEGMATHRRNRERLIAAWQAARKAVGRD
jgi:hypothetical protein